jgi:hypothetical protein
MSWEWQLRVYFDVVFVFSVPLKVLEVPSATFLKHVTFSDLPRLSLVPQERFPHPMTGLGFPSRYSTNSLLLQQKFASFLAGL